MMQALLRPVRLLIVVVTCGAMFAPSVEAFQRGGNSAQRQRQMQAMKQMQAQAKAYQEDVVRFQREMAAKNEEIAKRFDENGDGKLVGAEKAKYDKYMRGVQSGKEANPFADIKPAGHGMAPAAGKK
jgi:hypothetical protein